MTESIINTGLKGFTINKVTSDGTQVSDRDLVIADVNDLQLPDPTDKSGQIVLVKPVQDDVSLNTPQGQIANQSENRARYVGSDALWLQSDGSNWYVRSDLEDVTNDIPDIQDLYVRYDYDKASTLDTLNDQTGSGRDLSGGPISAFGTRNGLQTGVFDGSTGQDMEGSSFATTLSQPWHLFFTAQFDNGDGTGNEYLISSPDDGWGFQIDTGYWEIYDGSGSHAGNSSDTNWHVFDILYDGDMTLNVDGSSGGITDAGTGSEADTLSGFEIGDWESGGIDFVGSFGEALLYNTDKSAKSTDIRNYLNRWI